METPKADIVHRTSQRMRVRVPSKKGDADYFVSVEKEISAEVKEVTTNPDTGSILLMDPELDPHAVCRFASDHQLFKVPTEVMSRFFPMTVIQPIRVVNHRLEQATGGRINLLGVAFMAAVGVGGYQLLRGKLKLPAWHSALWYAFGIGLPMFQNMSASKPNIH